MNNDNTGVNNPGAGMPSQPAMPQGGVTPPVTEPAAPTWTPPTQPTMPEPTTPAPEAPVVPPVSEPAAPAWTPPAEPTPPSPAPGSEMPTPSAPSGLPGQGNMPQQ